MAFTQEGKEQVEVLLEPRSLVMLYGEARYNWKHAIPARTRDGEVERGRRVSLTLRKVVI